MTSEMVSSSETTTSNACLTRVNYWKGKHGKPAYTSKDSKNTCTVGQASNDKVKGWHNEFGKWANAESMANANVKGCQIALLALTCTTRKGPLEVITRS